jgi:hypothetical protein
MKRILEVKKKIGNLSKNSKNPFFKSQYLDLNDLLNEVEPLLHEQGLLLLQPIIDGKVWSIIISVEDNEKVCQSSIELPPITDPQKLGSCITYYRRYTLKSLLAIAEKDDDGNIASKTTTKTLALTEDGYNYLIQKGVKQEIETALAIRQMTETQRVELTKKLK